MVSLYGYHQSYDYKQMYDISDLRAPVPKPTLMEGGIMDFLSKNPQFSKFAYLITLADLTGIFNSLQAKFTLFITKDCDINLPESVFTNMDKYTARQILLYNCTEKELYTRFLKSSMIMYINTRVTGSKLLVENLGPNITINRIPMIGGDIQLINGVVHILSDINLPSNFEIQTD